MKLKLYFFNDIVNSEKYQPIIIITYNMYIFTLNNNI